MIKKKHRARWRSAAGIAALTAIVAATPSASGTPPASGSLQTSNQVHSGLTMLAKLRPGKWELRERGAQSTRQICLASGKDLIQLRHPGETCSRFVVEDTAASVIVQYTCRGTGFGRTQIRYESPTLAQIDTQGINHGLPFDNDIEGRRIGECAD